MDNKRKRVLRACDECRKKKVKCDGKTPCVHCDVYHYACTYNHSNSKKQRKLDALAEQKLAVYEAFVRQLIGSDTELPDDPDAVSTIASKCIKADDKGVKLLNITDFCAQVKKHEQTRPERPALVKTGSSQGLLTSFVGNDSSVHVTDDNSGVIKVTLPPLEKSLHLVKVVCDSALLFKFYNLPNLLRIVTDFYNAKPDTDPNYKRKLSLIYSFLAVGALLENDKNAINYYNASYNLLKRKIIETNDLMNIETLFCLIIFLQCTSNLSTCYSFVGIALRSAFRIGLHRRVENIDPLLQESRKRLFWSIYKIDIYLNTIFGLPLISDDDIDQDLPLDLDDGDEVVPTGEDITRPLSAIAISNDHTKLILILSHIVKNVYPVNSDSFYDRKTGNRSTNFISQLVEKVKISEKELDDWLSNLPMELDPENISIPQKYYRANRSLKLAFLHVRLALYRPFIHLIAQKYVNNPNINQESIRYGMNCINVAIKIVQLTVEMFENKLLIGGYWFSIYPIFYSVACLIYYIHEHSGDEDSYNFKQIVKFAKMGEHVLQLLKESSMAAAKTHRTLNIMFEQLNRRTKNFHKNHQDFFQDPATAESTTGAESGANDENSNNFAMGSNTVETNSKQDQFPMATNMSQQSTNANNDSLSDWDLNFEDLAKNNFELKLNDNNKLRNEFSGYNNGLVTPQSVEGNPFNDYSVQVTPVQAGQMNQMSQINSINSNAQSQRYYGSIIDKMDMNLFGKYLPPYMLESKSNNNNFSAQMAHDEGALKMLRSEEIQGDNNDVVVLNNNDNNPNCIQ